ncbi:MAG: glycerol-3-phosphate 1-O-acyltransferase PlsY [Candidatus Omnitrophica bacterium]|nr:glycerol-3-phosphate 1-O-acyltransferase PlsY [Candidatus Omnitrophota bacterium]
MSVFILISAVSLSYLLGALPTGWVMGRLFRLDIRQHGSGNVGATNVARTLGKLPGLIVLAVDTAKGWFPAAWISFRAAQWGSAGGEALPVILGAATVAGHIWNPFLQFQGGKGVATGLGVLLGLDPRVALGSAGIWTAAAFFTRFVSVASASAAIGSCFLMVLFGHPVSWTLGTIAVALSILARHRPNFLRLLHGEEHRIGTPRKS